jgi:hypothetical protein
MFDILNSSKLLMFSLVAYVFFIPISTSLMNLFLYIALILIGSLGASIIMDSGEGHLIMLFIAILFAPLSNQ